jgi:hypothetical protein
MTRVLSKAFDLDAFRAFVASEGVTFEMPAKASGEVLRFRSGRAICAIARRKNNKLTIGGRETIRLVEQFTQEQEKETVCRA